MEFRNSQLFKLSARIDLMFRQSKKTKVFTAFLLFVAFFYSWAACISSCEESVEHHNQVSEFGEKQALNENCCDQTDDAESCRVTATKIVLQERQTFQAFAPIVKVSSGLATHITVALRSDLVPEAKQNSPPIITSTPLFVQFRNFRI